MQNFVFQNPTRIVFGRDTTGKIGKHISPDHRRVLLITGGGSIHRTGVYDKAVQSLRDAGITWVECSGVRSNPLLSFARQCIDSYREHQLDAIVAIGGGSVIDTAKAVAAGVEYPGDVWDFFVGKGRIERAAPLYTVLTLAATASEMNATAVLTNEQTAQKYAIHNPALFPQVSVMDPLNTLSVPRDYSMFGIADAAIHLLEPYFTTNEPRTPMQDRFAEGIICTLRDASAILLEDLQHYDARAEVMWAATWALNGMMVSGMGPVSFPMHMIEHSLSALHDVPHGAGLTVVMPAWLRWAQDDIQPRLQQLGTRVFGLAPDATPDACIQAIENWFRQMQCPVRLQELDIRPQDLLAIVENAARTASDWGMTPYSAQVIDNILQKSLA